MINSEFRILFDELRIARNLSQEVLADMMYTSRQTMYRYLIAEGPIDFAFVLRTGAVFDLAPIEMAGYLTAAGYNPSANNVPNMAAARKIADARGVHQKNEVLCEYGYDAIAECHSASKS